MVQINRRRLYREGEGGRKIVKIAWRGGVSRDGPGEGGKTKRLNDPGAESETTYLMGPDEVHV